MVDGATKREALAYRSDCPSALSEGTRTPILELFESLPPCLRRGSGPSAVRVLSVLVCVLSCTAVVYDVTLPDHKDFAFSGSQKLKNFLARRGMWPWAREWGHLLAPRGGSRRSGSLNVGFSVGRDCKYWYCGIGHCISKDWSIYWSILGLKAGL